MKKQVRFGVFETNSSSTHSLVICDKETFDKWKNGELLFDRWQEEFKEGYQLTNRDKKDAEKYYNDNKKKFWKNWEDLGDEEKDEWYTKFAYENNLIDEDLVSYDDYGKDLEYFQENYTTKSGDEIVVFGEYGYDS